MKLIHKSLMTSAMRECAHGVERKSQRRSYARSLISELTALEVMIVSQRRNANRDSRTKIRTELSVAYLLNAGAVEFALAFLESTNKKARVFPPDWISGTGVPDADQFALSSLVQITNHSFSMIHLIEDGFDTPSRALLRVLGELTDKVLVLFSQPELLRQYFADPVRTRRKHLSARALRNAIAKLEQKLEEGGEFRELQEVRETSYTTLCGAVHSAYEDICLGSYAYDLGTGKCYPAIFGRFSGASRSILREHNFVLYHFLLLAVPVIENGLQCSLAKKGTFQNALAVRDCAVTVFRFAAGQESREDGLQDKTE